MTFDDDRARPADAVSELPERSSGVTVVVERVVIDDPAGERRFVLAVLAMLDKRKHSGRER